MLFLCLWGWCVCGAVSIGISLFYDAIRGPGDYAICMVCGPVMTLPLLAVLVGDTIHDRRFPPGLL